MASLVSVLTGPPPRRLARPGLTAGILPLTRLAGRLCYRTSAMASNRTAVPTFSSTAARPNPLGLVVEAVRDISSRRRLVWYLVRADLQKKGADSLLGNLWWVLDPLLQMLVYVVLVEFVFQRK